MNSNLHSTLILIAASGALLLGWIATAPAASLSVSARAAASAGQSPAGSENVEIRSQHSTPLEPAISDRVDAVAQQIVGHAGRSAGLAGEPTMPVRATQKSRSDSSRRMRRSMAMPFFSFAPRG